MKAQKTSPCGKLKKFQRCSFLRKNIEIDAYRSGAANQFSHSVLRIDRQAPRLFVIFQSARP